MADALASRWPQARLSTGHLPTDAVTWELNPGAGAWLDGSIHTDGQACYLRGDPDLLADHILRHRAQYPEPDLVLVCDAYGVLQPVLTSTTRHEVIDML